MTSEIVTRAEKAIRANRHNTTEVQAREAIRSLRVPTGAMASAAECAQPFSFKAMWQAAIDEALKP